MIEKLNECSSREEGMALLKEFSKKELLKLAYKSDIYVKSSLDKEGVIDRLVASTVGANEKYKVLMGVQNENIK